MKGPSTIIVAHRLGTIKAANRINVLESGEIVEEGTREELIKKQGTFHVLVKRQLVSPSASRIETLSSLVDNSIIDILNKKFSLKFFSKVFSFNNYEFRMFSIILLKKI